MTAKKGPRARQPATAAEPGYARLYISPLDPDLLKLVVPAVVLPLARNPSYHSIDTFPEKRFGFVELPSAEADKLKKKLHGAVLRGIKLRVEQASQDDMPKPAKEAAAAAAGASSRKKEKKSASKDENKKKRKRDRDEIEGVELEEGRKVKRGWTVPEGAKPRKDKDNKKKKDKKDKKSGKRESKSKYSDGPECLVKTILPPAATSAAGDDAAGKKKRKSREVVVHEFEKSTKFPTFLKTSATANTAPSANDLEFVDGKGWVDADGNVVQAVKTRPAPKAPAPKKQPAAAKKAAADEEEEEEDDDATSSSGTSSESEEEENSDAESDKQTEVTTTHIVDAEKQSAKSISASAENDASTLDSPRPKSSGSGRSLTIKIPPPVTPVPGKIHPLEALYKRRKPEGGEAAAEGDSDAKNFSFFGGENGGGGDGEEEQEDSLVVPGSQRPPMTPFTREDFEWRNIRSAAPTPDTAHPNRTFKLWPREGEEEDDIAEEDEDGDAEMADAAQVGDSAKADGEEEAGQPEDGDFQKWFWEHRGDLNRSWKKRRKTAAKEKRYRENKSRAERAI